MLFNLINGYTEMKLKQARNLHDESAGVLGDTGVSKARQGGDKYFQSFQNNCRRFKV